MKRQSGLKSLASIALILLVTTGFAQKQKIAILAPLYLDSAFDGSNTYRYARNVFPRFINPGLEFYEGAQLAIDSLSREGAQLEIFVFDTRSEDASFQQILNKPEMSEMDLVIANCAANEVRALSDFAVRRKIPVINTTVPNDGGTSSNPFFVLLNPTLKTQCEAIYQYAQKFYANSPIVVFRRKGASDNMVQGLLADYAKSTTGHPLKLKYVELNDSFTVNQLTAQLDSTRRSVCIAGSLDMNFGRRLAYQLATVSKRYPLSVLGMPTWDGIREFTRPEFKGPEFIYSTPFYNTRMDRVSTSITNHFGAVMYSRPSDMVFRGYEVTWKFAKLLLKYRDDLASNLGNKQAQVFTEYDIQPVLDPQTTTLNYFENKKLYFLKWQDGIIKSVN